MACGNDGVGYLHGCTGCTGWGLVVEGDGGLDSRLRGNDGEGAGGTVWRAGMTGWVIYMDAQDVQEGGWSSRETGVWIPACAGMTGGRGRDGVACGNDGVGNLHGCTGCTGRGLVVEGDGGLDSRLRGNDGVAREGRGGAGGTGWCGNDGRAWE